MAKSMKEKIQEWTGGIEASTTKKNDGGAHRPRLYLRGVLKYC